ncbi:MAG TPA: VCBS repeat-containing protein [Polyangia bacterium]|nr:VCBS repeat-containing protein [Polyangia bacterium]
MRKLYADEPDYETRWPVEFKVRIVEGLLQDLARGAYDLGDQMGAPYFADDVEFAWPTAQKATPLPDGMTLTSYAMTAPAKASGAAVGAHFRTWLQPFTFVERSVLKPKDAREYPDGTFGAYVAIDLGGREGAGWRHDSGAADVRFAKRDGRWRITRFVVTKYETQRAPQLMFADVTDRWLGGVPAETRSRLRAHSASDELHRMLLDDKAPPSPALDHLLPLAMDAHPGVVVVDVDGDGFDDLFVWDASGPATLLHNDGGRGFSDRTREYGLEVSDISAAAFADLDGDGRLDVVLGHWFTPSEIRFGAGGRMWPGVAGRYGLPAHVSSISLADIDGDGRLDIYFATAAHDFHGHLQALLDGNRQLAAKLEPAELKMLVEAMPAAKQAIADDKLDINVFQFGPRNVVMLNRGDGLFLDATEGLGLTLYRNSLQAAFGDLDGDGHPDLYVANDFAPANLYLWRNGRYVDISQSSGADQIFFGMGASLADFDNDGDLDLYATAMQSTAGKRIMSDEHNFSADHGKDARTARHNAARGNTLLCNDGDGKFRDLTATPAFATARGASWSYSSQFVDIDGDGWLDIFAPNGFFTSSVSPDDPFVRDL